MLTIGVKCIKTREILNEANSSCTRSAALVVLSQDFQKLIPVATLTNKEYC